MTSEPRDGNPAATRDELYARAKERGIEGRSTMSKDELRAALADGDGVPGAASEQAADRFEAFRDLAERVALGEFVMLPRMLSGDDRRLHVRQTLREDHQTRIARRIEDAEVKFDNLAGSLFAFFRGTSLLFYRDMAGEDAWMPTVLTLGDVHPKNFGIMPNAHNVPFFGVNDFDESYYAPFTWDIKRGAVGFMVAVKEVAGYGRERRRKIVRRFVRGYVDSIRRFAEEGTERDHEVRIDNAPELIRDLIEDAHEDRADWLADDYLDEFARGFRSDDDLVPLTARRDEFQQIVDRLVEQNGIEPPERAGEMRVKDVAQRRGQGTASLGLARYYVLIEGPRADGRDDLILELEQARRSALAGLVPPTDHDVGDAGNRVAHAQKMQLVRGDVFHGSVEIDGRSFLSRERVPYKDDIDLDDLSKSEWKSYAEICGEALAHAHALSDEGGELDHDIEPKIVAAVGSPELFADDVVRFAEDAFERVRSDHAMFRADHALGAFAAVDKAFR